jgi:hypothetical protein
VKTEAQILETLAAIRAALPKVGPAPERVDVGPLSAKRGMLRVTLTNARGGYELIGEWGHGVAGWMQFEHSAYFTPEARRVYRAVQKALKVNP